MIVFCSLDQPFDHIIMIRSVAVLDADGYLTIRAFQPLSDATHIYGQQFLHIFRSGSAGTVTHFLEDRDMLVDLTGQLQILVFYIFCEAKQNSGAELVIQKTALDVTGLRDAGPGIHADEGTILNTQCLDIFPGRYLFIQQDFHGIEGTLGLLVIAVDMDGSIRQLYGAFVYFAVQRIDTAVLGLDIVGV